MEIPVLKPSITDSEIQAVTEVLRSGWLGLGPKTAEFEEAFATMAGAKYCVGLNSGTAALHLAMTSLNLKPEDEVIRYSNDICLNSPCDNVLWSQARLCGYFSR